MKEFSFFLSKFVNSKDLLLERVKIINFYLKSVWKINRWILCRKMYNIKRVEKKKNIILYPKESNNK